MTSSRTNELLGYPPDARLLIVNADDFGMYPAINDAIVAALTGGIVTSTTLMLPCPAAAPAMAMLKQRPEIAFGVHLTIIRDLPAYRYGPLAPAASVPSLVDASGHFLTTDERTQLLAQARRDEVEIEFRAQIDAVLAAGLTPTHLDWHCLYDGGRADILDVTLVLAKEYGLAIRVGSATLAGTLQRQGLPTNDHGFLDSFSIATPGKAARYATLLRELPPGLSEWAVHPGHATAAAQALDGGWPVRQADFAFLTSPEARTLIRQEGIILLSYSPIRDAWGVMRDT